MYGRMEGPSYRKYRDAWKHLKTLPHSNDRRKVHTNQDVHTRIRTPNKVSNRAVPLWCRIAKRTRTRARAHTHTLTHAHTLIKTRAHTNMPQSWETCMYTHTHTNTHTHTHAHTLPHTQTQATKVNEVVMPRVASYLSFRETKLVSEYHESELTLVWLTFSYRRAKMQGPRIFSFFLRALRFVDLAILSYCYKSLFLRRGSKEGFIPQ